MSLSRQDVIKIAHLARLDITEAEVAATPDPDAALASLTNIESLEAHWLLPGHGSPWTNGVAAAVAAAAHPVGVHPAHRQFEG